MDLDALGELVAHNVAIKARVVQADPFEKGERAHLNFGHTFGHAIEKVWLQSLNRIQRNQADHRPGLQTGRVFDHLGPQGQCPLVQGGLRNRVHLQHPRHRLQPRQREIGRPGVH